MAERVDHESNDEDQAPRMSLVPLYSPLDVTRGIQAYRRGDVILYTVRGEPAKVQELIGELDRRGVGELVALVSHRVTGLDSADGRVPPDETGGGDGEESEGAGDEADRE